MAVKQVTTTLFCIWKSKSNKSGNANAGTFVIKFTFVPSEGGAPQYLSQRSLLGFLQGATTNVSFKKLYTSNL